MYSDVVLGIEINHFEKHLERAKEKRGVKQDSTTCAKVFTGCFWGWYWKDPMWLSQHCNPGIFSRCLECCARPAAHFARFCKLSAEDCELLADDLEKLVKSHLSGILGVLQYRGLLVGAFGD